MSTIHHPEDPAEVRDLFLYCRAELSRSVVGHADALDRLALVTVRAVLGDEYLRVLLVGPSGSGKTTVARVVARLVGTPLLELSAGTMVESGWQGADIGDHLSALLGQAVAQAGFAEDWHDLAERAVLLISELDRIQIPPPSASSATREQRIGKQASLLPVLGGDVLTIERGSSAAIQWRANRALIICAGVFEDLDAAAPSAGDLIEWGMLPELAERIARGAIIRLAPLSRGEMAIALGQTMTSVIQLYRRCGYRLEISPTVLTFVARHLADGTYEAGIRAGTGWLEAAAERVLVRLLKSDAAPLGTRVVLGPDDVEIPRAPRARWRE